MIFVDTSVFMYAVGRAHPLQAPARAFFREAIGGMPGGPLVTSAEVLQELLHAYLAVERYATLDAALELLESSVRETWSITPEDVIAARMSVKRYPALGARDLLHLACCSRRDVKRVKTFDRALGAAFA